MGGILYPQQSNPNAIPFTGIPIPSVSTQLNAYLNHQPQPPIIPNYTNEGYTGPIIPHTSYMAPSVSQNLQDHFNRTVLPYYRGNFPYPNYSNYPNVPGGR